MVKLKLRDIFKRDLDVVFHYRTPMVVLIRDKWLGIIKHLISLSLFLYTLVYVLIIEKAYLVQEYTLGESLVFMTGTALSITNDNLRIWDATDLAYPNFDSSAVIIGTFITERTYEKQGRCTDPLRPCSEDSDCILDGTCVEGLCEEPSWCSDNEFLEHNLEGVENFLVWVQGTLRFDLLAPEDEASTFGDKDIKLYPDSGANVFLLSDLLGLAGVAYEDIRKSGVVLKIIEKWDCDVTWSFECSRDTEVERVDEDFSYHFYRYHYYRDGGEYYRDSWEVVGVRVLTETRGKAEAVTLNSLVLNVTALFALLGLAPLITDFIMLNIMPMRKRYYDYKYKTEMVEEELREKAEEERESDEEDPEPRLQGGPP